MLAYTGIETVSNLAEEVRDPVTERPERLSGSSRMPSSRSTSRCRLIALSALPVHLIDGELTTLLALAPEEGGFANDPMLGVVQNLGLEGGVLDALKIYVGVLAATILFIATNAGVIGASRITYSMATLPADPGGLSAAASRASRRPGSRILIFGGSPPDRGDPSGRRQVRGHALLARGDALVHGRARLDRPDADAARVRGAALSARGRISASGGIDWPLFAIFGGTRDRGLLLGHPRPERRPRAGSGLGWIVGRASLVYAVYRRRFVSAPLLATVKAAARIRPGAGARVPAPARARCPRPASDDALDVAASLAAERGAQIAAVTVLEIPLDLPLSVELPEEEERANRELDEARAIGDTYGVSVIPRLVRGRNAGAEIVREAERRGTEIIVIGAPRTDRRPPQARGVRQHRRLRAQERAVPGDGDGDRRGA